MLIDRQEPRMVTPGRVSLVDRIGAVANFSAAKLPRLIFARWAMSRWLCARTRAALPAPLGPTVPALALAVAPVRAASAQAYSQAAGRGRGWGRWRWPGSAHQGD